MDALVVAPLKRGDADWVDVPEKNSRKPARAVEGSGRAVKVNVFSPVLTNTECMRMKWKREPLSYRRGDCLHAQVWPKRVTKACGIINIDADQVESQQEEIAKVVELWPLQELVEMLSSISLEIKNEQPRSKVATQSRRFYVAESPLLQELLAKESKDMTSRLYPQESNGVIRYRSRDVYRQREAKSVAKRFRI